MSIVVFFLSEDGLPLADKFRSSELSAALKHAELLRKTPGTTHICISSENPDSVGKLGVSSIEEGKTPDGHAYDWKKRR
jgi:hypothetical protein